MTDPAPTFRAPTFRAPTFRAPIFRREALRARTALPSPGAAAPATPRWIAWACWALLALLGAGLTAGALIRVGTAAQGPAVVRQGSVQAVVPAAFAAGLRRGTPLELTLRGRRPVVVAVTGTAAAPGALLVVRATAPPRVADGATGTASVQARSQPLIVALAAGLVSDAAGG